MEARTDTIGGSCRKKRVVREAVAGQQTAGTIDNINELDQRILRKCDRSVCQRRSGWIEGSMVVVEEVDLFVWTKQRLFKIHFPKHAPHVAVSRVHCSRH
jgi:hypothetical protein